MANRVWRGVRRALRGAVNTAADLPEKWQNFGNCVFQAARAFVKHLSLAVDRVLNPTTEAINPLPAPTFDLAELSTNMTESVPGQDALISQFIEMTGATTEQARELLSAAEWDLEAAVTAFWNPEEEQEEAAGSSQPQSSAAQPIPTTSSAPPVPAQAPKKKFATLGDLSGGGTGGGHAGHGHDDDTDDDDDERQDLYAGGEKSGLAVENPDDLKKSIIAKAKKQGPPGRDNARTAPSHFRGTAHTLGGDDAPSQVVEDPSAAQPSQQEPITRVLHFWADGFSVDDGPLYRLDDPANADILTQIKMGRAPFSILNVKRDEVVDVKLEQHTEDYVQPQKKYKPFSGGGQRLGSPTPGVTTSGPNPAPSAITATYSSSASAQPTPPNFNEAEPTIQLQIRIGDGTRLVARFNTTNTIGDIYDFVNAANASSRDRSWALMTTFPSVELQEKAKKLEDIMELKKGGTVIQKWK